eukprot:5772373-Prymnesium_polylepis.1
MSTQDIRATQRGCGDHVCLASLGCCVTPVHVVSALCAHGTATQFSAKFLKLKKLICPRFHSKLGTSPLNQEQHGLPGAGPPSAGGRARSGPWDVEALQHGRPTLTRGAGKSGRGAREDALG